MTSIKIKILVAFVFVVMPVAIHAQDANAFIGSWRVNVTETLGGMEARYKAKYDSLPQGHRSEIIAALQSEKLTFNADKTIVSSSSNQGEVSTWQGSWAVEATTSHLVVDVGDRLKRYKFRFITPLMLRLDISEEKSWFHLVYLTKD